MSTPVIDIPATSAASTPDLGGDDLRALLRSFMESTQQLEQTHTMLQQQVASLQQELVEARAKLRRSESLAALGQMAAGIAHEIRNPLGSIQLFVQVLEDELAQDSSSRDICRKIGRAVRRMDAIVGDVLQFARDTKIRPQQITVDRLIDDALRCCESLIRTREARIERCGGGDESVEADPSLLNMAISNVVRNAIEAVGLNETPVVSICGSRSRMLCPDGERRERLLLAIEDNGPGVSDEVIARMFNPFFTTREAGTGLGLAIVHRIVDAHGGHVTVSNATDPHTGGVTGARFELALPVSQISTHETSSSILTSGNTP